MIASMTAYARTTTQQAWGQAIWEVRSINHRYLDVTFKMSDNFREWELDWRNLLTSSLHRGKVDCYLTFIPSSQSTPELTLNRGYLEQLLASCDTISQYPTVNPSLQAMDLLRWPEVLVSSQRDLSFLKAPLTQVLNQAVEELILSREREGNKCQEFLQARLDQILQQVAIVKERLPLCLHAQKQKLEQKLAEISLSIDKDRLAQEIVFYTHRLDVEEEIERLTTHVEEVKRAMQTKGAVGRRLDFLMQELNREANTLGAKSADNQVTQAAIELKVLIEQMREQIQNVE